MEFTKPRKLRIKWKDWLNQKFNEQLTFRINPLQAGAKSWRRLLRTREGHVIKSFALHIFLCSLSYKICSIVFKGFIDNCPGMQVIVNFLINIVFSIILQMMIQFWSWLDFIFCGVILSGKAYLFMPPVHAIYVDLHSWSNCQPVSRSMIIWARIFILFLNLFNCISILVIGVYSSLA